MNNVQKIVKKSTHWWKHGKHKGMLGICIERNRKAKELRERRQRIKMFDSIPELLDDALGKKY